jgi:predicted O-methyltransferase YrrM
MDGAEIDRLRPPVSGDRACQHRQETDIATSSPVPKPATWAYADGYLDEDEIITRARTRAAEVGVVPVGVGVGMTLRFVAAALRAQKVVEIGTGTGVSGLWMLRGMAPDGVLTTIDRETEHQRLAREAFTEEQIPHTRLRLIPGRALDVLPRLVDGDYDLVHCDGDKQEYAEYFEHALRLLRSGGVVAFDNALWHDKVADPAQRDAETVAIRELGRTIRQDERVVPVLLPVGDGLLAAVKR